MKRRALPDLPAAIEWLKDHWTPRDSPVRLHEHSSEGWGPFFTANFARWLDANPSDTVESEGGCVHPNLLPGADYKLCQDCNGSGITPTMYLRYRDPMFCAMDRVKEPTRVVILTFVINRFSVADTLGLLGIGEGQLRTAIRRLFDQYQERPTDSPTWVEKSESQQQAEMVA